MMGQYRIMIDEENGCEICWKAFKKEFPRIVARLTVGGIVQRLSPESLEQLEKYESCPHDPPDYARGIILLSKEDREIRRGRR